MKATLLRPFAIAVLVALLPTGCSTISETATDIKKSVVNFFGGAEENLSAEELAIKGMEAFEEGNYKKSIEHFQRLKDIYPFSKYSILGRAETRRRPLYARRIRGCRFRLRGV